MLHRESPLVIGHRGYSSVFPENTMFGFDRALQKLYGEQAADAIELDIQLTKDGVPVVIHDETVDRMTNGHGRVRDMTLGELNKLTVKPKRGNAIQPPQKISTLAEVLAYFSGKDATFFLEIKDPAAAQAVVHDVHYAIENGGWNKSDLPIISFNADVLRHIRNQWGWDEKVELGVSVDGPITDAHLALADELGSTMLVPNIRHLTGEMVSKAHDHGCELNCWTCNSARDIDKAIRLGVDGIMGDDPTRIRERIFSQRHK